jgi:hypothetical protein
VTIRTSNFYGHFFFTLSCCMSRWISFFWDHRLNRPIIPLVAARSIFLDLISNPSLVPKAALRQRTLSGHGKHSRTISLNPSFPTGKTLSRTPKQSFLSMIKLL